MDNNKQHTLKADVCCDGIGLHSGNPVAMTLKPAPADTGIVFIRTDLEGRPSVPDFWGAPMCGGHCFKYFGNDTSHDAD